MSVTRDQGSWIAPDVVFAGSAHIGFCSCIGYGSGPASQTYIGNDVEIGAFCVVSRGVRIEAGVMIDHYCRVGPGSTIGRNTRILYGAQVFDNVKVGENCIIGGHLIDRTIVEDEVTYSGDMAHLHSDPTRDWDTTEEPSPTIRRGTVVGVGALIIGSVTIGPHTYIGAGEIVRTDIPEEMVLLNGKLKPLAAYRGMIKVRG
jgi:acetyltransferase-like isoleucine patch superfamily enzyme